MEGVSRRAFTGGLGAAAAAASLPVRASTSPADARIAIIDVSKNPLHWADRLHEKRIKVIARYYARQAQPEFPSKRLAYSYVTLKGHKELESEVLIRNNISILSLYQYKSATPEKFEYGLKDTKETETPTGEAKADVRAALQQAQLVQQPKGSAIYFGVDVDVVRNDSLFDAVRNYFDIVRNEIAGDYKIGAYGCGTTCKSLLDAKMIDYTWVSASPGHEGTPEFISSGRWHLFQNSLDRKWFNPVWKYAGKDRGLDLDTSVQNPHFATFGAWGAGEVAEERTRAIFNSRRFVKKHAVIYKTADVKAAAAEFRTCKNEKSQARYTVEVARNVRAMNEMGDWCQVDVNEDGEADGFCRASDLGDFTKMPAYRRDGPKC
jgi:hypothetical protein